MDVEIAELFHQQLHDVRIVVYAANQDGLIAHRYRALEKEPHRPLGDPADLVGVVEVRVDHDFLPELPAFLDDRGDRVDPGVIG